MYREKYSLRTETETPHYGWMGPIVLSPNHGINLASQPKNQDHHVCVIAPHKNIHYPQQVGGGGF